jgi:2-polyprenyl-6-methoxyphenol hydroxylase-like FAD-dependent oxidoreductase
VHYPIRNDVDETVDGTKRQLVNWLWEIETPQYKRWDWNRAAKLEDFIKDVEGWRFDWLDVPAFFRAADVVLEYPMVDKDPLPAWSFGRATLLGDAAHPMVPRGSNGAGQAILDARCLASLLKNHGSVAGALKAYEAARLQPTSTIVLENRRNPPDAILREVYERTGDKPFGSIDEVISVEELRALTERYKRVAGYDKAALRR